MNWKEKIAGLPQSVRGIYLGDVAGAIDLDVSQVVEVGVGLGCNAKTLRQTFPKASIYLVDPYRIDGWYRPENGEVGFYLNMGTTQADLDRTAAELVESFRYDPRAFLMRMPSGEAATRFPDGSLDVVFIDDDHSYEGCSQSIRSWLPKVRSGGILAGHDVGTAGVDRAVEELLGDQVANGPDAVWVSIQGV